MFNELFYDLFGQIDLGDNVSLCIFIFGCLCVSFVFSLIKLFIKAFVKK